jgi:transcription termination/antitermination protein NusA
VILSRSHPGFVRSLFELEVPEVLEGTVEIKSVAREAGDRAKISVYSKNEKVDCVGACVGIRGSRVKGVVKELQGEKIDIVRWSDNVEEYIRAALSPAEVASVKILDPEEKKVEVVVNDDQLSLAIGKNGQNVRLASKLTGWSSERKARGQYDR